MDSSFSFHLLKVTLIKVELLDSGSLYRKVTDCCVSLESKISSVRSFGELMLEMRA